MTPTRKRPAKKRRDPVDVHVGARVKARRTELGLSQGMLAEKIGVTYQQQQKYETATTRVSASRLFDMGRALDVPVAYFFDDMPPEIERKPPAKALADPLASRGARELVLAYRAIPNRHVRRRLFILLRALRRASRATPSDK